MKIKIISYNKSTYFNKTNLQVIILQFFFIIIYVFQPNILKEIISGNYTTNKVIDDPNDIVFNTNDEI